jgi:hypothetical protein
MTNGTWEQAGDGRWSTRVDRLPRPLDDFGSASTEPEHRG